MAYSDADLEAMQYDPIALRRYFWCVAMGAKRRSLVTKREVIERGRTSPTTHFKSVFAQDRRARDWADVDAAFSEAILSNLDDFVSSCLIRPKPCATCRKVEEEKC